MQLSPLKIFVTPRRGLEEKMEIKCKYGNEVTLKSLPAEYNNPKKRKLFLFICKEKVQK